MARYDGGGISGDINWSSTDMPYMWEMVSGHEHAPYQPALDGWRQSYELVLMHRTQVETYKDKLMQAWPPERNKASQAYIERLDQLIASLTETYDAAVSNYTTFSAAISAVASAKSNMKPLQEAYAANEVLLAKHEKDMTSWSAKYTPPKSPVADGQQEHLRQQAAAIMTSLTAELAAAQTSLVHPRPYSSKAAFSDQSESLTTGGAVPMTPVASNAFSGSITPRTRPSSSVISKPTPGSLKTTPTPGFVEHPGTGKNPPTQGPILGEAKPPIGSPSTGVPTPPSTSTNPSSSFPGQYKIGQTGNPPPSTTQPRIPATNNTPGTLPPAAGSTGVRGGALPHSGIIGGNAPIGGVPGSGRSSQTMGPGRGRQKVNPVGGLLGQEQFTQSGQRRSSRSQDQGQHNQWDPDNPWETKTGMDPVLLPSEEQRIDPGPTIGGR
ncbi:hypothetical protein [Actinoplanes sp. G11-F43]|uniref:hypothetical protein n=1 Tax=Actinoplanes sp. G11-F43 TaxID=3424130 RepID=UPI003D34109B